ncbi:MAG: MFS transporter [Thermoguttaceae bacterium]|nr:MFS transporter [Thermoguttaceae bacterium]MDW8078872.1 MFS transporter [Thermoguttaceae bacterium]
MSQATAPVPHSPSSSVPSQSLWNRSFIALLVTQFTVALNDNMFRWLIVPIGKELIGQDTALWLGAVCFLAPFLLLAGWAGFITDKHSKRGVIIWCKAAELLIMAMGIVTIWMGQVWMMFVVLFLMGAQTAFFSPSKYGSIPEIVPSAHIATANGWIGMTTMVACILGAALGGYLYSATTPPSLLLVTTGSSEDKSNLLSPGLLAGEIRRQGFRLKQAENIAEAIDQVRRGAPELVIWDEAASGRNLVQDLKSLFSVAGGVPVILVARSTFGPDGTQTPAPVNELPHVASEIQRAPSLLTQVPSVVAVYFWPRDREQLEQHITSEAAKRVVPGWENLLPGQLNLWISAAALLGVASVGLISSLFLGPLRPANPHARFPINPFYQVGKDLVFLWRSRALLAAALASGLFWGLGAMSQPAIDKLARPELVTEQHFVGYLLAALNVGIATGALFAGLWSPGKIELGLVPWGALGIILMALGVSVVPQGIGHPLSVAYVWASVGLFLLGVTAALYDIPLMAFLQAQSPADSRGRVMAANNFVSYSFMISMSAVYGLLTAGLGLSARQVFGFMALVMLPVFGTLVVALPIPFLRVLARFLVFLRYRLRVEGAQWVPRSGGVLLTPNHVTWVDWIFLSLACPRPIRFVADPRFIPGGIFTRLAKEFGVIQIEPGSNSVLRAVRAAQKALRDGEVVCVFPEGGLSRTGQIQGFQRGYQALAKGAGVPIVPVFLGGLWGSIFSYAGGRFFWKWPNLRQRREVVVRFGKPLPYSVEPLLLRRAVEELGLQTMLEPDLRQLIPARRMLRALRQVGKGQKCADSLGAELSGYGVLLRAFLLRRYLRRILGADEKAVAVMLPPSVASVVSNAALALDRRIAVNLNYTLSESILNLCIRKAKIGHVITSRRFLERFPFKLDAPYVILEDIPGQIRLVDKLLAFLYAQVLPIWVVERWLGLTKIRPDDVLTIIFTSGSTGQPKGVMLSHRNIGSNVLSFCDVLQIRREDVMLGVLPFFHSFGYTVTMWTALMLLPKVVYHPNPLEPRVVGEMCRKHRATIFLSTPTFLRSYVRRCEPEDFATVDVLITGAEKLPPELAQQFAQKFGVKPVEGYGTTELSPVVCTNIPPSRQVTKFQPGLREGSVGRPLPGVVAKVVDPETGQDLGANQVGELHVKGPNVMLGYLDEPEKTAAVLRHGWYATGDLAKIDEDGFIYIVGRISRFSKIAGEMVPHEFIEEKIRVALGIQDEERPMLAVLGIPDEKKGERIVVAHTGLAQPPEEICRRLAQEGLPALWMPSPDSFCQVPEIPITGSGKVAFGQLKELVRQQMSK